MAKNTLAVFAKDPKHPVTKITATTTDKSGGTTTNMKKLYTVPADDAKITEIQFTHSGNSGAGLFLIWITDSSGGNMTKYKQETIYAAVTSSTTVPTASGVISLNDLQLEAGQEIWVGATVVTSDIHVSSSVGKLGS